MSDLVLAIDPGITGAAAIFDKTSATLLGWFSFPVTEKATTKKTKSGKVRMAKDYDGKAIHALIDKHCPSYRGHVTMVLEKVNTMPTDGRVGAFNFGASYGFWKGFASAKGMTLVEVMPTVWQNHFFKGMSAAKGFDKKALIRTECLKRFPEVPIMAKTAGVCDAVLIGQHYLEVVAKTAMKPTPKSTSKPLPLKRVHDV